MKKLTSDEQHALVVLSKFGSYCPGLSSVSVPSFEAVEFCKALDGLVRKKRVRAVDTDDGPRFYPI